MQLTFNDLLSLEVNCQLVASSQAVLLVIGDGAEALSDKLCATPGLSPINTPDNMAHVLFGFSIMTAPFPLLVGRLMTERNTLFDKLSLFGWVEDNAILEPRAEVLGLTPFGEQPILFLRDLDLDRPVEAWIQTQPAIAAPARWLRVAGVAIADSAYAGDVQTLSGDAGAVAALSRTLPADAQPFLLGLANEVAQGKTLRAALRTRRKTTDDALMHLCDGWRILAHATKIIRVNPAGDVDMQVAEPVLLEPVRKW
jgi:hypothetical protein